MKQFWYTITLLICSLLYPSVASAQTTPGALLEQMEQASQSLNYEIAFISVSRMGIESLRYRHAIIDNKVYAQLLQMDGPRREIIQRGNDISYFEAGLEPFTLSGGRIIDTLPSIIYGDFSRLSRSYDFIPVGRARVADHICDVIRIVARDGTRYSFIVWVDTDTKLPLRVDMLDRDGQTLEQYRVISFTVNDSVRKLMQGLTEAAMPPSLSLPPAKKQSFSWQVGWLPQGMQEISQSRRDIPSLSRPVESRLYSDGLFSFSVNISQADKNSVPQLLRNGWRTVQTEVRNNTEITVVGELPPSTAKRIADSVTFGMKP